MNDLPATLDQLTARLETLEKRVHRLEHPAEDVPVSDAVQAVEPSPQPTAGASLVQADGIFSVFGRALLGIAGAFLLRAVAESTSLPRLAIAAVAIAYALLWLVWAARVKSASWVPSAVYAGTSAVILSPMLWELTRNFKVLAPSATAAILALFVAVASALAWKRDLAPVLWVANATATVAALALGVATHQFIPFLAAILLMVLLCEVAAAFQHEVSLRPFLAAAADLAIWALMFVYTGPENARVDYPVLGAAALILPACALLLIHAAVIVVRTTLLAQNISIFETVQAVIAFLLAVSAVLAFAPRFGTLGVGVACLALAGACYALVPVFARGLTFSRNYQVIAAWGTCLLIAGGLLSLPTLALAPCLSLAAVTAVLLGGHFDRLTLQVHGTILLIAAAFASGLPDYAFHSMAGPLGARFTVGIATAAVASVACYALIKPVAHARWTRQAIQLVPASLALVALAAFLVRALLVAAGVWFAPEAHHVAFVRTFITCALALCAALAGSHWRRHELSRIAYATLALVAAKLVLEDLRLGHLGFIAASISFFAITLILVPRLARLGGHAEIG